jgi:hypothetical protein
MRTSGYQSPHYWPDTALPYFNFNGHQYPMGMQQTLIGEQQSISASFPGYVIGAFQANPIVFACEMARLELFSEARFQWRRMQSGRPGDYFGTPALEILEKPWPKATTGDLLKTMLLYGDFGGSCFLVRTGSTITPLRPDWVTVVFGSDRDPRSAPWDVGAEMMGVFYQPGGSAGGREPDYYQSAQLAHFAPFPDPLMPGGLGMPWVRAITREVMSDQTATAHKLKFFEQGATPNMIVTVDKAYSDAQIDKLESALRERHEGLENAYRTLIFRGGESATVVGKDLQQLDFKAVQGASETRICVAARVPAVVAGISEGLQGSSLNAGNFQASMRRFADITMRPLWRNAAGSLEAIVPPPNGANLWYDDRDVPALKDDIKDAADVQGIQATSVRTLVDGGFEPDAVIEAITAGDLTRLKGKHSGLLPVQLQPPNKEQPKDEPGPIPEQLLPFAKKSDNGKPTAAETLAPLMKKGAD